MFLHRVKMNWKRHQTLTLAILLVALARIVLENIFGEALLAAFAILKFAVMVWLQRLPGRSSRPAGNWGRLLQEALYLRRCIAQILPRLLGQNGGSVNGHRFGKIG